MFKPLLRSLPTLSGNIKLACIVDELRKVSNNNYETEIRYARMAPLNSNLFTKYLPVSLSSSSFEWDVKNFYNYYSDIFWNNNYNINKYDIPIFNRYSTNIQRNIDFEFGCKRISYQKNNYQFAFYTPIYIDNVNDIPDKFVIKLELDNGDFTSIKYIHINLYNSVGTNYEKYNYLYYYLNNYISKIDSNVIYIDSKTKTANYYGIDVKNGGFNIKTDLETNKIFVKQNTIHNFDNNICLGFKRNNLMIKQVIPLCFYFNVDKLFDNDIDKYNFRNATINISGEWYDRNGYKILFYDWDCIYTYYYNNLKVINMDDGTYISNLNNINIMNVDYPSLNESLYINYRLSNILQKDFSRWKLQYSSDENPYVVNLSPAFSYSQGSTYKYGEFPSLYKSIYGLVYNQKIENEYGFDYGNNLILPFGEYNKDLYKYLNNTQAYENMMNENISKWFELYNNNITNIIDFIHNAKFSNVHGNKTYYNGVMYNFNDIYNNLLATEIKDKKIDKFGVFLTLNYKALPGNLDRIKYADDVIISSSNSCVKYPNAFSDAGTNVKIFLDARYKELYTPNSQLNNIEVKHNEVFELNTETEEGDFINLFDYGIDVNEFDKYYLFDEFKEYIYSNLHIFGDFIKSLLLNTNIPGIKEAIDNDINVKRWINNNDGGYHDHALYVDGKDNLITYIRNVIDSLFYELYNDVNKKTVKSLYKLINLSNISNIYIKSEFLGGDFKILFYDFYKNNLTRTNSLTNNYLNKFNALNLYYSSYDETAIDLNKHKIQNTYKFEELINDFINNSSKNTINNTLSNVNNKKNIFLYQLLNFINDKHIVEDILLKLFNESINWLQLSEDFNDIIFLYNEYYNASSKENFIFDTCDELLRNIKDNRLIDLYKYYPSKTDDFGNILLTNYVERVDDLNSKFYGDNILEDYIEDDIDVIYMDPYNYNQIVHEYNQYNIEKCSYINNDDDYLYTKYSGNEIFLESTIINNEKVYFKKQCLDYYCKFFNITHLMHYLRKLYDNANSNKLENYDYNRFDIFNNIFVRMKKMYVNKYNCLHCSDMYVPINEYFYINRYDDLSNLQELKTFIMDSIDNVVVDKNLIKVNNSNFSFKFVRQYKTLNNALLDYINKPEVVDETYRTCYNILHNMHIDTRYTLLKFNLYDIEVTDDWFEKDNTGCFVLKNNYKVYTINNDYIYVENQSTSSTTEYLDSSIDNFIFNLCFKKPFVKVNKDIMKVINLQGLDSQYTDLYLYVLEDKDINYTNHILYKSDYSENKKYMTNNNFCLAPLYNDIYLENKDVTVIYNAYNINEITPTNIISSNEIVETYYRYAKNDLACLVDISEIYNNNTNDILMTLNGISYYTYSYFSTHENELRSDISNYVTYVCDTTYTINCLNEGIFNINNIYSIDYDKYTGAYSYTKILDNEDIINHSYILYKGNFCCDYLHKTYRLYSQLELNHKLGEFNSYVTDIYEESNYETTYFTSFTYYDDETYKKLYGDAFDANSGRVFNYDTLSYVCYVKHINKINKLTDTSYYSYSKEISVITDDLGLYDKFNMNTYEYIDDNGNKTTYGFYLLELSMNNTSNTFNLINEYNSRVKYIDFINSHNILKNRNYIYDIFKMIIPFMKIDIFKEFDRLDKYNTIVLPSIIKIPVHYIALKYKDNVMINDGSDYKNIIDEYCDIKFSKEKISASNIICERYFDSIEPIFKQTSNIDLYNLKFKDITKTFNYKHFNDIYYSNFENIYKNPGIRIYDISNDNIFDKYKVVYDYEYKYFNDNRFYNLENEIIINVDEFLSYGELVYYESEEKTIEMFKNYINSVSVRTFDYDEILFLYNKYGVQYLSNSDSLFNDKKTKRYKLTYKFSLL